MANYDEYLDALEQDTRTTKVYCQDCAFFDAYAPVERNCRHPHARQYPDTYRGKTMVWIPAEVRNDNNTCPDFTPMRTWRATIARDLRTDPLWHAIGWLMLGIAGLLLLTTWGG